VLVFIQIYSGVSGPVCVERCREQGGPGGGGGWGVIACVNRVHLVMQVSL